jgi:hypothetical protein
MAKISIAEFNPGLKIGVFSTAGTAFSMSANDLHFVQFTAQNNCTITTMSCFKSAQTAGIKSVMGIYTSVSGLPSALLGQSSVVTTANYAGVSTAGGGPTYHALTAPINLVQGTTYWLAYIQDTTANVENAFNAPSTGLFIHQAQAGFASGVLPATVTGSFPASGGFTPLAGW